MRAGAFWTVWLLIGAWLIVCGFALDAPLWAATAGMGAQAALLFGGALSWVLDRLDREDC